MSKKYLLIPAIIMAIFLTGCKDKKKDKGISKEELQKVLSENPSLITDLIEKNPDLFMKTIRAAARKSRPQRQDRPTPPSRSAYTESDLKSPQVVDTKGRASIGTDKPTITIIEYSDFECPFCKRGYERVKSVKEKYPNKVKFVYKHLPLPMHPNAELAAQYFEAIALQDGAKAYKWHDLLFENQRRIRSEKEALFKELASKVGADMKKLSTDVTSDKVKSVVRKDMQEAQRLGIRGTPGFIVNGVRIRGAVPLSIFEEVIEKTTKKKDAKTSKK